jgi:hypothetical protein
MSIDSIDNFVDINKTNINIEMNIYNVEYYFYQ